ncbi:MULTISPECIES: GIY-YIG nuclease family protein [unclassified Micromonospora]|uniref:GIY-YIG nuclease family protein n=1 Tax=unclassified Micromonospora TaxID=2617518 RepID=UPI003324244B
MLDAIHDDLLADFTPVQPYTTEAAAAAPQSPGVHVVLEDGKVIYVGFTGNLRNRLRQHLTGNRESSVLHQQVGQQLDKLGPVATATDIADWLGRCEVRWRKDDNPQGAKEALVLALKPRFNRQIPKPRPAAE